MIAVDKNPEPVEGTLSPEQAGKLLAAQVGDGKLTPEEAGDHVWCMARESLMALIDRDTLNACDHGKANALDHLNADLRERVLRTMAVFNDFGLSLGRELRRRGLVCRNDAMI